MERHRKQLAAFLAQLVNVDGVQVMIELILILSLYALATCAIFARYFAPHLHP